MKKRILPQLLVGSLLVMSLQAIPTLAKNKDITCPVLTPLDVRNVIEKGRISTDQGHTLFNEAELPPEQVVQIEPTANPYDTFYQMMSLKKMDDDNKFFIYIGNVLASDNNEAKKRAAKILITSEAPYFAKYDRKQKTCIYTEIEASPSIPNYPFKSHYETVVLAAVHVSSSMPNIMLRTMHKLPSRSY